MSFRILKSLYGKDIILDEDDFEYYSKWNWGINSSGYARRTHYDPATKKQRTLLLHKDITKTDKNNKIDHINRNKLDNRKQNLRVVSQSVNCHNQVFKKRTINTNIPYAGVDIDHAIKIKKYFTVINVQGVKFNFGGQETAEEAAKIYDCAALYFFGQKTRLNYLVDLNTDRDTLYKTLHSLLLYRYNNPLSNLRVRNSAKKQLEILNNFNNNT